MLHTGLAHSVTSAAYKLSLCGIILVFVSPWNFQRRALQQQVNLLGQEVSRLEQELDEAQERGDRAMLQVRGFF